MPIGKQNEQAKIYKFPIQNLILWLVLYRSSFTFDMVHHILEGFILGSFRKLCCFLY